MNTRRFFIVGDSFSKFLENSGVVSIGEIEHKVFSGEELGKNSLFFLGQGVAAERINALLDSAGSSPTYKNTFCFSRIKKSGQQLVHKSNSINSMITEPKKTSEHCYEADVLVDEHCDEIRDHIAGQHIPGMVLVEASRQMFLAVTELFFLNEYTTKFYFVINSTFVEYYKFVFPLDIKIYYSIVNVDASSREGRLKFSVSMDIVQNEKSCAKIDYEFSTYEIDFLVQKEGTAAASAIALRHERREVSHMPPVSSASQARNHLGAAYFDVDNTVINIKSMFSFLEFAEVEKEYSAFSRNVKELSNELREMKEQKIKREEVNKHYYGILEGTKVSEIEALGRAWFKYAFYDNPAVFNLSIVNSIAKHRQKGFLCVFVSGSFEALLKPIGDYLDVKSFICAPLEVVGDRYTGKLTGEPVIGQGKAVGIKKHVSDFGVDLATCFAYGDDITDIPMLSCVGNPRLVNPSGAAKYEYKNRGLLSEESIFET